MTLHRCPVGFCDPTTALPVEVSEPGQFCTRHWLKLSLPMQHQLQGVRVRGNLLELRHTIIEAIKEARALDEHWYRFAVVERERVEPFEEWEPAVRRYFDLQGEGFAPALVGCSSGKLLTNDEIRSYCHHEIRGNGQVLGSSKDSGRPQGYNHLQWAVSSAYKRYADAKGFCGWPGGVSPTAVNLVTDEEMDYGEAVKLAASLPIAEARRA